MVFPIHPRTRKMVREFGMEDYFSCSATPTGLWPIEPLGYLEFLHLNLAAAMVFTDSGGLQEETTVLGVPCVTLRKNTERPITCLEGSTQVVGNGKSAILEAVNRIKAGEVPVGRVPDLWDGRSAIRIVEVLAARV